MKHVHQESEESESGVSTFPQTLWTLVLEAARDGDDEKSQAALRQLCVLYREPIRAWLARHGTSPQEEEDLTQGFIQHLLESNRLRHVEHRQTKFRSFLIECLNRYTRGEWRKQQAARRGGGLEALDLIEQEPGILPDFDRELDLDFALTVHRRTLARLESERYGAEPGHTRFLALRCFIWGSDHTISYAEVGQRLQITLNHVKKAVFDLRRQYFDSFRVEVMHTVADAQGAEETRYLMTLIAGQGGIK